MNEENVLDYLKQNPNTVKRYLRENCNLSYLSQWLNEVLNKERVKENISTTPPSTPNVTSPEVGAQQKRSPVPEATLPGIQILSHDKRCISANSFKTEGSRRNERRFIVTSANRLRKNRLRRWRAERMGFGRRRYVKTTAVPGGDNSFKSQTETTSSRQPRNNTTKPAVQPQAMNFSPCSRQSNKSQSNRYTDYEVKTSIKPFCYLPLRSFQSLATHLLRGIRTGEGTKEAILSCITASICEGVPVDGSNLYLRDDRANRMFLQPENQPISDCEHSRCFEIGSRETLGFYAAETGRPINTDDMPNDVRVRQVAIVPSGNAKHVIAQPILDAEGKVHGVIEVYRAGSRRAFSDIEKQMISTIVSWSQLVLESQQKIVAFQKSQQFSHFILDVVRNLFSKVSNMDHVIKAIMDHAKDVVRAERVTLFLLDSKTNELYSSILDVGDLKNSKFVHDQKTEVRFPISVGISGYAARTGEGVRTNDPYNDSRFYRGVDEIQKHRTSSVLAVPLFDGNQVVGVLELINKCEGQFSEEDQNLLKSYSAYCGLAINVARMYDRIYRSDQKYRVALEVMTYHSIVSEQEVEREAACTVPTEIPGIKRFDFSPWDIPEENEVSTLLYMIYDLSDPKLLDKKVLTRFILTCKRNYRSVPYHNWDHALSVTHSIYFLMNCGDHNYTMIERVCLMVACICHDLDHRGHDNGFMKKYSTPLAALYSSSPMEHHHFNMAITILQQKGHNIFKHFKDATYRNILGVIKHAILSTDLANFWGAKAKLEGILDSDKGVDWSDQSDRMAVIGMALPTCDLCAMYKPWDIQVKIVMLIVQEFWAQGDEEKAFKNKPLSMMDRDEAAQVSNAQVGFIKGICIPCFSTIARVWPSLQVLVDTVTDNMEKWGVISQLSLEEKLRTLEQQLQLTFPKVEMRRKRKADE
ncbi:unnamed protein product [Calicophoron daubneyi]|uniref:Phosphodiesterase n=1 Tax=Calicophoron daubneyi TaxID=300641 RepID=A0AAV2TR01_CALDB